MSRSVALTAVRPRTFLLLGLLLALLAWAVTRQVGSALAADERADAPTWNGGRDWTKPADDVLRARLGDLPYRVTQHDATERAFLNEYWDNKQPGIYVDIVSGEPLFSSLDKYASGTGWPSFVRPIRGASLKDDTDYKLGYARTEVRSKLADSHLGHVFPDGPPPTGQRYCINSAALDFVPVAELEARGYGEYVAMFREAGIEVSAAPQGSGRAVAAAAAAAAASSSGTEIAILAGGCYWGMEDLIRELPGVVDTEVGFCGGTKRHPKYEDTHSGDTGHAEAIRVEFDPERLSYAELLDFFFRIHDPTTVNRQGNDRGSQYRSAIFVRNAEQRATAERVKAEWNASGRWKKPIVTEIADATEFWPAKESHQDYLEKIPNGYTCHFVREWDEDE
jgi:peptide methionine sulfoxide reductase msrA/msrB